MASATVIVMVKEPRPGQVKTRLARGLGYVAAAWWFRHQTRGLLRRIAHPKWTIVLAVAPDAEGMASRVWPSGLARVPQGGGNLGDRMRRVLRGVDRGPAVIIGGDIPGITKAHLSRAFAELGHARAVLGPAPDGGYWLVGLRRPAQATRKTFADVRWSTEHAMADTCRTLPLPVATIDVLSDVDTVDDLRNT